MIPVPFRALPHSVLTPFCLVPPFAREPRYLLTHDIMMPPPQAVITLQDG